MPLPQVIGHHLLPFSEHFQCCAGSQWFTLGRLAADSIVDSIVDFQQTTIDRALSNHYRDIYKFSEESYFQRILCNAPHLNLQFDSRVYLDWSEQMPHPKQLTLANLEKIQASPAYFARKIDIDSGSDLLDALDGIIDGGDALAEAMGAAGMAH